MNKNHYAVIMAGGIGSRFWPMSRNLHPKQFIDVLGTGRTLIQATFDRFREFLPLENIYVITHIDYTQDVHTQLPELQPYQILSEPARRNTAPCIAYASNKIYASNPAATLIFSPADHLVVNTTKFAEVLQGALSVCEKQDIIMTLGILPTRPDTGYGYIQFIETEDKKTKYHKVKTFTEKPDLELARTFLQTGEFLWNSGIFIFSTKSILAALKNFLPDLQNDFLKIKKHYNTDTEYTKIVDLYEKSPNISIDYAVMEKAANVYVTPASFGWSDLGTWNSLYEQSPKDYHQNAIQGNLIVYESTGNVIKIDNNKLVVIKDINDLIIVDTNDVLLICSRNQEQSIRDIVADVRKLKGEQYV
ncbi:MAG: mannose-1-phosphate guanylyltransferase [Bacteroidia bacterium]|nr:mannose-1-phosphate guanylyltransferase [Bacteroidia bacterium]